MKLNKNSETSFENIIVLIFIFVLSVIFIHRYLTVIKYAEMSTYKKDINKIDIAIVIYKVKYGKFPDNLSVLVKKNFVKNIKVNKKGYPVTPFGKRFVYKRKIGAVILNSNNLTRGKW
ncbi:type II secretion system protein GspG [Candidatus Acidulodesulfobacterium sp. H_13]|uniref:type II secretion system protein GspG n=1 Tax=Candidatus Acidulodesulfobacterium sp. H_13 TaxID=3395470 RepID=UPI003AF670F7